MNWSLTKIYRLQDGWIYISFAKSVFDVLNIVIFERRVLFTVLGHRLLFSLLSYLCSLIPLHADRWLLLAIDMLSGFKKTQRGQITNRSCHPKVYRTRGTISGLEAESPRVWRGWLFCHIWIDVNRSIDRYEKMKIDQLVSEDN